MSVAVIVAGPLSKVILTAVVEALKRVNIDCAQFLEVQSTTALQYAVQYFIQKNKEYTVVVAATSNLKENTGFESTAVQIFLSQLAFSSDVAIIPLFINHDPLSTEAMLKSAQSCAESVESVLFFKRQESKSNTNGENTMEKNLNEKEVCHYFFC